MRRHEVSDEQWAEIEPFLPDKAGDPRRTGQDYRSFVNAVFWIARLALRGETCPNESGHGIRSTDDSIVGAKAGSGGEYSQQWAATRN
jgi:transposase